jgi:hypothetical protein
MNYLTYAAPYVGMSDSGSCEGSQASLGAFLPPYPVSPGAERGRPGMASDVRQFGPPWFVQIDGLVAESGELANHGGLAGSRHPSQQHPLHPSRVNRSRRQLVVRRHKPR